MRRDLRRETATDAATKYIGAITDHAPLDRDVKPDYADY